jgi:hypothetical protein
MKKTPIGLKRQATLDQDSHIMDSDLEVSSSETEASSADGNVQEDCGLYSHRLLVFHRNAFYAAYNPEWEKASKSSHLISKDKYDEIVSLLRTKWQKRSLVAV